MKKAFSLLEKALCAILYYFLNPARPAGEIFPSALLVNLIPAVVSILTTVSLATVHPDRPVMISRQVSR
ncbi:hypothetical protein [Brevibacillus parabrevis]|uniref:hypothetical protein n=1 Tax=Brevibacillus parabrevis TaxID=54914 RepID=UPI001141BDFD|nr:hypothetical protein [Brevibacillus parabrevis]MDR4999662.1 hypothetical protein [Brevibacillus parabrevis]